MHLEVKVGVDKPTLIALPTISRVDCRDDHIRLPQG